MKQTEESNCLVVGFTGHRHIEDYELILQSIDKVLGDIVAIYGNITGLTSAASGADTLFIQSLNKHQLNYQIVLPFSRDLFQQDFSTADWAITEQLIDLAKNEQVLASSPTREDAFLKCGKLMVDESNMILAVWNGNKSLAKGGTADIVTYAQEKSHPLIIINSKTGKVSEERIELLRIG